MHTHVMCHALKMNYNDNKARTINIFLNEIRKLKLTGDEFLTIIGNTKISNDSYTEIKTNPQLTYNRLVEIFYDSPLSEEDFIRILKAAVSYCETREAVRRKKQEEELINAVSIAEKRLAEKRLSETMSINKLKSSHINHGTIPFNVHNNEHTKEISSANDSNYEYEPEIEEYIEYDEFDKLENEGNLPIDDIDYDGENYIEETYTQPQKHQKSRTKYIGIDTNDEDLLDSIDSNRGKIAVSFFLSLILVSISFYLRYSETGSFLVIDEDKITFSEPVSYSDIAERFIGAANTSKPPLSFEGNNYLLPKETDYSSEFCTNNKYIFRIYNNSLYTVEINNGKIKPRGIITTEDKKYNSIFLFDDKLYAILEGEYIGQYSDISTLEDTKDNSHTVLSGEFTQPTATIIVYDALKFNGKPLCEITVDGKLTDVLKQDGDVYLITDYTVHEPYAVGDLSAYIPSYSIDRVEPTHIKFENIFMPPYKINHLTMTVIAKITDGNNILVKAVSGGQSSWVYAAEQFLFIIQQKNNQTEIIQYDISNKSLTPTGSLSLPGIVYKGGFDYRQGIIRAASKSNNGTTIYIYNRNLEKLSEVKNIAEGKEPANVLFDDSYVYVIAENLYVVSTVIPNNPALVSEGFDNVYSDDFLIWSTDYRLSLSSEIDDSGKKLGLRLAMHHLSEGQITEIANSLIAVEDGILSSPTETDKKSMYFSSDSSLILIPVSYFNGISQIDKFLVYTFDKNTGFSEQGEIVYYDWHTKKYAATAVGDYIYTFWDNTAVSADSDGVYIIDSKNLGGGDIR